MDFTSDVHIKNEFRQFHDEMRRLTNPRMFYPSLVEKDGEVYKNPPYVRPKSGTEVRGKLNQRIVRRAKVKALKEAYESSKTSR